MHFASSVFSLCAKYNVHYGDRTLRVLDCTDYFMWFVFCAVVVSTCFVMCVCVYVCVCVCVDFVMCGCGCVDFVMCVCMCGFCNVWVCVCVDFVMCGCVYAWIL